MNLFKKRTLTSLLAAMSLAISVQMAHAAQFPTRPITLVVPFAAGGGTDSIAREIGKLMSDRLGQAVIVENRGGAGGAIGADLVAKAKPDGYTLLFATSTFATNAAISAQLPYDPINDFSPVAMIGRGPLLLVSSRQLNVNTVSELIAIGKARPEGLSYCSAGEGSINHLAGELLRQRTGIPMTHIPFKGSGPATIELLAGRVDIFVATVPTILSHTKDGQLSVLAVTGAKRSPLFPNVPTMAQAGIPNFEVNTWWGVMAPAKTPQAIVDQLNKVINEAAASNIIKSRLQNESAEAIRTTPAGFKKELQQEINLWRSIVSSSNLTTK
jgi:tripartite-type tricarboxylate transporter receptor subunit TctC